MKEFTFKNGLKISYDSKFELDLGNCREPKYIGPHSYWTDDYDCITTHYDVIFYLTNSHNVDDNNKEIWYLGYESVPHLSDKVKKQHNEIRYWFNGKSKDFEPICTFYDISDSCDAEFIENANILKHCNAEFLNDVKEKIIAKVHTNFNVTLIKSLQTINQQYGYELAIYKKKLKNTLKNNGITFFHNNILNICRKIKEKPLLLYKHTVSNNRYWWIHDNLHNFTEDETYVFVYLQDFFGLIMTKLYNSGDKSFEKIEEYMLDYKGRIHTEREEEFKKIIENSYKNVKNQESVIKSIMCVKYNYTTEANILSWSKNLHTYIKLRNKYIYNNHD